MPTQHIPILHEGILYDVTITEPNILSVYKTMEDSGIGGECRFEGLPKIVKEMILREIKKGEE